MTEQVETELSGAEPDINTDDAVGQAFVLIGYCLLFLGAMVLLGGLMKSGAPEYSDTLNIGLLNDKTNLVLAGGFLSVCGAIFASSGMVIQRLTKLYWKT